MNLNPEQLKEIENFAGLYFTIDEVAEIMELDKELIRELYSDKESDFYKSYKKGFLTSESKVRKCILDLALRNSSPAQDAIKKIARDARNKNLKYDQ
jgi:hypothetical protein